MSLGLTFDPKSSEVRFALVLGNNARWKPPTIMRGSIVLAASTILSMPGCEHPTTSTIPSGFDRQRQLVQFQCARFIGDQRDEIDVWCDLDRFVHELEVCAGPGRSKPHEIGRRPAVIALYRR